MKGRVLPADEFLLLALALVVAPHVVHLQPWVVPLAAVMGLWRWAAGRGRAGLPGKWFLAAMAFSALAGILLSHGTIFGRDAGVALLTLLGGLKLLELRGYRDALILVFLGYFLVVTNFLYSQSVFIAVYMLAATLAMTTVLVGINHPGGERHWRVHLRLAGRMLAQAVPVMVVLFVLFPRLPGPLWGMPADSRSGMTGLSDEMSPGSISQLSRSNAVAFRVEFEGASPKTSALYWRGPVMWFFDGRRWKAGFFGRSATLRYTALSGPVNYTVTLEPHNKPWLFALDLPAVTPERARITSDFQVLAARPVTHRERYAMTSYLDYRTEGLTSLERRWSLLLPGEGNPRTRELGREWRGQLRDPAAVAARALRFYREETFAYTLSPPLLLSADPVDEFLFGSRKGFCEHYAGSFVVLMRAAGIPARVVTGYQGGEFNALGGYLTVRQSDAHAWAEVWLEGRGWVRVDPTAAVSPTRVESGIAAALPAPDPIPGFLQRDSPWLQNLRFGLDFLNGGWNLWVLSYNQERQMQLLARLGFGFASWREMAIGLLVGVAGLLAAFSFFMLRDRARTKPDPASRAYRRFCKRLAKVGLERRPEEGPLDFAARVAAARPDLAPAAEEITALYVDLRYGPGAGDWAELRRRVGAFRP